jgi:hypothetical protein
MNSYTKIIPAIKTTQVTMHRGNQRLWLQNASETLEAGFIPHAQYRTDYLADRIVLTLTTEGKTRRVSKCGRGATLDINNKQLRVGGKYDFSNGIRWSFQAGVITIKPIQYYAAPHDPLSGRRVELEDSLYTSIAGA